MVYHWYGVTTYTQKYLSSDFFSAAENLIPPPPLVQILLSSNVTFHFFYFCSSSVCDRDLKVQDYRDIIRQNT